MSGGDAMVVGFWQKRSALDPIFILVSCLFVAGLVSWRLLTGSTHEQRHERSAYASTTPLVNGDESQLESVGQYEAVSISICTRPCAAARAMRGQRYLKGEAPALPLAACDHDCGCSFQVHADRRGGSERRTDFVQVAAHAAVTESRKGRDRRRKNRFRYQGIY